MPLLPDALSTLHDGVHAPFLGATLCARLECLAQHHGRRGGGRCRGGEGGGGGWLVGARVFLLRPLAHRLLRETLGLGLQQLAFDDHRFGGRLGGGLVFVLVLSRLVGAHSLEGEEEHEREEHESGEEGSHRGMYVCVTVIDVWPIAIFTSSNDVRNKKNVAANVSGLLSPN